MKLQLLLNELQKDYELNQPFKQESPGVWKIPISEGVFIQVTDVGGPLQFSCTFMDAPVGKDEDLYLNLLSANLFGQETRGAVLSLSNEARRLTLSRVIDYDINFKEFSEILEDFINSIDFWREEAFNHQM